MITVTAVNRETRFIMTADKGKDSLIIIWDLKAESKTNHTVTDIEIEACVPIKTIFDPHSGAGTVAAEFSADSKYIITLGAGQYC
jgi:hypothetical protein